MAEIIPKPSPEGTSSDRNGIAPAAHAVGRHTLLDGDDPPAAIQPDEIEREAHSEGVHRAAARNQERRPGPPKSKPDEPLPDRSGNEHFHDRRRTEPG